MARESESYRDNLESLLAHFRKHWVYPKELGQYMGVDYRTVMKKFDMTRNGCSIEVIARRMSK